MSSHVRPTSKHCHSWNEPAPVPKVRKFRLVSGYELFRIMAIWRERMAALAQKDYLDWHRQGKIKYTLRLPFLKKPDCEITIDQGKIISYQDLINIDFLQVEISIPENRII